MVETPQLNRTNETEKKTTILRKPPTKMQALLDELEAEILSYKYHDLNSIHNEELVGTGWIFENATHVISELDTNLIIKDEFNRRAGEVDKIYLVKDQITSSNKIVKGTCCKDSLIKKEFNLSYDKYAKPRITLLGWLRKFRYYEPVEVVSGAKRIDMKSTDMWRFFINGVETRIYFDKYEKLPLRIEVDDGAPPTKTYYFEDIEIETEWRKEFK